MSLYNVFEGNDIDHGINLQNEISYLCYILSYRLIRVTPFCYRGGGNRTQYNYACQRYILRLKHKIPLHSLFLTLTLYP